MKARRGLVIAVTLGVVACGGVDEADRATFRVEEATIAQIHEAMEAGILTASVLVEAYLARITEYDRQGPALNALITVNPDALIRAAELDAAFAERGLTGPLHGIPVIVKDNYDIAQLPTSAGSLALADSVAPDDAFQVRRIRDAGAIVLAKSNMAEFAFSPYETVGSRLPGYTRNPYALNRVTAGSSGGTAAAVAASFATVGLGTDTGNSIRGPAAHQALVGLRSTMGLTSRDGIVPLNLGRDIGGPIARTVADAVVVFEVIAGHDPADPVTAASLEHPVESYAAALREDALARVRLGVLRAMSDETADPEVIQRFDEAIADLRRLGAVIVDPVALPEPRVQPARTPEGGGPARCSRFRFDLDAYLASLGPDAPVKTLADIVASRQVHPSIRQRLASGLEVDLPPSEQPGCAQQATRDERLRVRVRAVLRDHELDALIFPTWDNPPRLIGDLNSAHGDNSQQLSPPTGFPALSVPMGYVGDGLPVGLQMLGDAWSEQTLFAIAYAYEQGTHHRVAPASTPPMQ